MSAAPSQRMGPPPTPALRSLEALWRARGAAGGAGVASGFDELRAQAMQRVLALGLPTSHDETWRYTNLRALLARGFVAPAGAGPAPAGAGAAPAESAAVESLVNAAGRAATALLVNGHPQCPPSQGSVVDGLEINVLSNLSRTEITRIGALLMPPSDADAARWALVNTALFSDALHLRVTGHIERPVLIRHLIRSDTPNGIVHPRVLVEFAPGASATLIEHHVEEGAHPPLSNSVTEIVAGREARVEHYRLFSTGPAAEHIDSLALRQDAHSHVRQFTAVLGGGLVRTALEAHLNQAGAAVDCHSLLVGYADRHVDCVNVATHHARDTRSRQTARAIASGTSRVVFNTKVVVDPGAVHADSEQSFRGLLLSPTAEIDSRPQLQIHADEVKCAHGATTGRLSPDMLFYLLSRGLDRETAQTLLVYAFLADVLTGMSVASARAAIETALVSQLPESKILEQFR